MTEIMSTAEQALRTLKIHGADHAAVSVGQSRSVECEWRMGELERLQDKTHRSLGVEVYVNGRYAGFSTNDLRADALEMFLSRAVAMTELLEPDPYRVLPTPPKPETILDLDIYDTGIVSRSASDRKTEMQVLNSALETNLNGVDFVSYSTSMSDGWGKYIRLFSTGFSEHVLTSSFSKGATVSLKDDAGRLPLGGDGTYARHQSDLQTDTTITRHAVERAQVQLNATPIETDRYTIIIINRAMGKVLGPLLRPLGGAAIQQGRSLWKDKLHEQIVSPQLTIRDEPHLPRALGSSQFDGDGFETVRRPLIENGVLKTFLINQYYAKKLDCARTSADTHNLTWQLGALDLAGLIGHVQNGLLIERFLGGNCNETTGNFSFGCAGRRIENGLITTPFSEANLSGNLSEFWHRLDQIGNDPRPQSTNGAPSCAFTDAQVSGA